MNLDDPSTRKRTLLGFPVTGATKRKDLQDDLNALVGVLVARGKPHFEQEYESYDFVVHQDENFNDTTEQEIKRLCNLYNATFLITK